MENKQIENEKVVEDLIIECFSIKEVNIYVEKGYELQHIYTKKEYSFNHQYNYMTLHDAYTTYIMVKK